MIIPNQTNLKIHIAGAENLIRSNIILKAAKCNYILFTIYPFLCDRLGIKHGYQNKGLTYKEVSGSNYNQSKHCIQDSGLFSVMFGKYNGAKDKNFIYKWYDALVETTNEGYKGTIVEVDCQKVLGEKLAWELRMRMKNDLPNNRQINVFHKEDGQKGLDKMIEFSDYIAISVPELRSLGKKNYTERIANYIKNKKPTIDIHLLGCTENKLLNQLNFCSSADSTSWLSVNKFGWFKYNNGNKTITIKKSNLSVEQLKASYYEILTPIFKESKIKLSDSLLYYHSCELLQLEYLLKQYSYYAGNQD